METKDSTNHSDAQSNGHLDQLLNKYVSVWLWSILFGTTTGVLYTFLNLRFDRWGGLGLILVLPALFSLILAILSWLRLYHALAGYLIPRFILDTPTGKSDQEFFAYQIRRSFFYFVCAAAFRAIASLLELVLASSSSMG